MVDPTVSICIRAWRRPEGLRAAIASVLSQTYRDVEVVVVDDAGDAEDVAREFDDERVAYRRNERRLGPVASIPTAFGLARGRFLGLLDDDDRYLPEFVETAVAHLEADPGVGVVFSNYSYDASGWSRPRPYPLAAGRHERFLPELIRGSPVGVSSALIRREAWEEGERSFPLAAAPVGDQAMWIRTALGGWAFVYLSEPLAVYSVHPGQLSLDSAFVAERVVRLWDFFGFDDPECERLRRARLSEALLRRARVRLAAGAIRAGMRDVIRARRVAPGGIDRRGWIALTGLRTSAARYLAAHPRLVPPALGVWRRLQRHDRLR